MLPFWLFLDPNPTTRHCTRGAYTWRYDSRLTWPNHRIHTASSTLLLPHCNSTACKPHPQCVHTALYTRSIHTVPTTSIHFVNAASTSHLNRVNTAKTSCAYCSRTAYIPRLYSTTASALNAQLACTAYILHNAQTCWICTTHIHTASAIHKNILHLRYTCTYCVFTAHIHNASALHIYILNLHFTYICCIHITYYTMHLHYFHAASTRRPVNLQFELFASLRSNCTAADSCKDADSHKDTAT